MRLQRDAVCERLGALEAELRARNVTELALFGSVARDEAGPDSDVDVVIDTRSPFSVFALAGVQQRLERELGRPVDILHKGNIYPECPLDALRPRMRAAVLRDLVQVF